MNKILADELQKAWLLHVTF